MKKLLLVLLVASVLLPSALAQAEPFVVDGEIAMQIVADTPQDVIIGSQVAAYLQQFQDRPQTGLATTPEQIDLDERGFILIGAPEDNNATKQALAGREVTGATLAFIDDDFLITGRTHVQVQDAAEAFMRGQRSLGELEQPSVDQAADPLQQQAPSNQSSNDTDEQLPALDEVTNTTENQSPQTPAQQPESCESTTFCDGDIVKQRSADCSEQNVRYCANGCFQGACQQGFFAKVWSFISFWN